MHVLKIIFQQSSSKLKLDFLVILLLSLSNSFLEVFGIGMLIPIFNIMTNFENFLIFLNKYLYFFDFSKSTSQYELLKISLLFLLAIFFLKYLNYFYLNRLTINFAANLKIFLSTTLFYSYTSKSYSFFQNKNSSTILRDLFVEVNVFCDRYILSLMNIIMEILLVTFIVIFLFFKETNLIISFIFYFIPLSLIFNLFIKKKIEIAALKRNEIDERKLYIVKNFLANIKVIKTLNKEIFFINAFRKYISNFEFTFANFNFIQIISKPFFEFAGFLFIIIWLILNLNLGYKLDQIYLSLIFLVVASIRLLPSMNRIVFNLGQLRFSMPSINIVLEELNNINQLKSSSFLNKKVVKFNNEIFLKNISFNYSSNKKNILFKAINLKIKKGDKICFIGESGSGKTTLIEIIAGLLKPCSGSIIIDKKIFFDYENSRLNLTYVPQDLTLIDGTIADNICLGTKIKNQKLKNALKLSLVSNFLHAKKQNVSTNVGEIGRKFSGGQRQRINIARSFYENSDIIIFDESISSVDESTKIILINNIFSYFKNKTIIFVLHDKSFLKKFNKIYEFKNGKLLRL